MKKIILLVIFGISGNLFSQNIFDKYEEKSDVSAVVVSQKMFEMFSNIDATDKDAKDFMQMAKKLTSLKMFSTSNEKVAEQMKTDVISYKNNAGLEEIIRVKDSSNNSKFYVKSSQNSKSVSELLVYLDKTDDKNTIILLLKGEINLEDLGKLASKLNLPKEVGEVK
ncbi:MAG: DUF4252 domain-containing protein [Capnocytophaga sp.]|nr:DUF4252 domain-containing protein [Capnocytophaga sp.]